jgi:hypothetical protein
MRFFQRMALPTNVCQNRRRCLAGLKNVQVADFSVRPENNSPTRENPKLSENGGCWFGRGGTTGNLGARGGNGCRALRASAGRGRWEAKGIGAVADGPFFCGQGDAAKGESGQ